MHEENIKIILTNIIKLIELEKVDHYAADDYNRGLKKAISILEDTIKLNTDDVQDHICYGKPPF